MFKQLSPLTLLVAYVAAITIETPTNWNSGGLVTINWTPAAGDPVFSFELVNQVFNNAIAIANNVDPSLSTLNLTLPIVPAGPGYQLEAVNITNINDVYASTPEFSIGETVSTTSSSPSSSASSTVTSGVSSSGAGPTTSSTPFGVTITNSRTGSTVSGTGSSGTSGTGSSAPSPSTFNGNGNGAASLASLSSWGVMALAAVAGASIAL